MRKYNILDLFKKKSLFTACLFITPKPGESPERNYITKRKTIIGRDQTADICIDDYQMSRSHFAIIIENEEYFLKDLGSTNGTVLNDKILSHSEVVKLSSGDSIETIGLNFTFVIKRKGRSLSKRITQIKSAPISNFPTGFLGKSLDQKVKNYAVLFLIQVK